MPTSPPRYPTLSVESRPPETGGIHVDTSDFEPFAGAKGAKDATPAGPIPVSEIDSRNPDYSSASSDQEWWDELRSDEARLER